MRFYSVMGNRPDEPGALSLMAEILCQSGTEEQVSAALTRCARECQFPVRLPDILRRIPGQEVPDPEAEARAAFDAATKWAKYHVRSGPEGDGIEVDTCHLEQRIQDTVRRCGGWRAFALAGRTPDPFLKKEFLAEYRAWNAIEHVNQRRLLKDGAIENRFQRLLSGKEM